MKFEKGMKVWLSSPAIVKHYNELCQSATVMKVIAEDIHVISVDCQRIMPPKYVFPSRIDAEAAGRAFVRAVMAEERRAFEERMGKLHKMLKEEER